MDYKELVGPEPTQDEWSTYWKVHSWRMRETVANWAEDRGYKLSETKFDNLAHSCDDIDWDEDYRAFLEYEYEG